MSGTTVGAGNDLPACIGINSEDVAFAWAAPATGRFRFTTCGSSYNTTLTVAASCESLLTGTCANDQSTCLPHEIIDLDFSAGQRALIVIDGNNARGSYALAITQL